MAGPGSPPRTAPSPSKTQSGGLGSPSRTVTYGGFSDIKAACGEQVDSRKPTAPSSVFGTSTRPQTSTGTGNVPGPGAYQMPPSISKPVVSTIRQAPSCSISGREKFGSTIDYRASAAMPGPGAYTSEIVNPREKSSPKYSLGKRWANVSNGTKSPGPGSYEAGSTIGRTVLSTQKSLPITAFPKVERKPLLQPGSAEVGPGQYSVVTGSVGKQHISNLASAAAFSFGSDARSKPSKATSASVPGPNSYQTPSSMGSQVQSLYKSSPKCSMSGRTKFGSHF